MPAAPPATVGGAWCEAPQIVMHGYCNPYPPDWDDEGDVCANDDMPDQAYCSYELAAHAPGSTSNSNLMQAPPQPQPQSQPRPQP